TAAPIVDAIEHSENVATELAIAVIIEQASAAKDAPPGINGDQANDLSRKTNENFIIQLLRWGYSALRGESGFAWKEYRAGGYRAAGAATATGVGLVAYANWPAILSFIVENAEALRKFVSEAFHNPALSEIIEYIVRALN